MLKDCCAATATVAGLLLPPELPLVGSDAAAEKVIAKTDPKRLASIETAPALSALTPSRNDSVVATKRLLLNDPAAPTEISLRPANASAPVTARRFVSLW